jgi:pyruvate,orthophosphate dikinase
MFGSVVLDVDHHRFEEIIEHIKLDTGKIDDTELTAAEWHRVVDGYKEMVREVTGKPFPQDPWDQLWGAIGAVFGSWMNQRAITYRRLNDIPAEWGTAVNVQAMVFGNMGEDCATGVCFTRDPSTGENIFYGEYLINAQGEDVVAGIRTPQPMAELKAKPGERSMEKAMPGAYAELVKVRETLERHYADMQDIEFTVQSNKLYMLQTRNGKRTAAASLKIAVDMAREGLIDHAEAVKRVNPAALDQLLHPTLDPKAPRKVLAKGLPASPGAASGIVVFSADEAEARAQKGESVILVRIETSPEDIHGMHAAKGILTTRGGMTSHAAVVARGMGRPCVAGCGAVSVDYNNQVLSSGGIQVRGGEVLTIDGGTGEVYVGPVAMVEPQLSGDFGDADGLGRRGAPHEGARQCRDAARCRDRAKVRRGRHRPVPHRAHVLRPRAHRRRAADDHGETESGRRTALEKLLPFQRQDFADLFRSWRACRSPSACSIRRCTSSCRIATLRSARSRSPSAPTLP